MTSASIRSLPIHPHSYPAQLRERISKLLPQHGLELLSDARRWSDRMLVMAALLMGLNRRSTLRDSFAHIHALITAMYPSRKRAGDSYSGFIKRLAEHSLRLLTIVGDRFRQMVRRHAGDQWLIEGWCAFAVDGTKVEAPRSDENLEAFGTANKEHAAPQLLLVALIHMGTQVLWNFVRDVAAGSEREMLRKMLPSLPPQSLLLGDAGFTGFAFMHELNDKGVPFVVRAGSNVKLLKKLGFSVHECADTVYVWPKGQQRHRPPLTLRQLMLKDGKGKTICLLTSVLDKKKLSDKAMIELYRRRWGVELWFRTMKQTMEHAKLKSRRPQQARAELDWCIAAQWLMQLIQLTVQREHPSKSNQPLSEAEVLRVLHRVFDNVLPKRNGREVDLMRLLAKMVRDTYQRKGPKQKRHNPRRARKHDPTPPVARMATTQQVALAKAFTTQAAK